MSTTAESYVRLRPGHRAQRAHMTVTAWSQYPPEPAVAVTSERIAHVSPAARTLIGRSCAPSRPLGNPPISPPSPAPPRGIGLEVLLAELHERDVARLDTH